MSRHIFITLFFGIGLLGLCKAQNSTQNNVIDTIPLDNPEPYRKINKEVDYRYHKIATGDDECQLYVKEAGLSSGNAIIFLHGGWGMEHTPLAKYFVNHLDLTNNYRLIFYDQRGSMRSPCKGYDSISVSKHVKDLERIRKKLKIDDFKIVGWSMGSYLGYKYLEKYGNNVDGFVSIGAMPIYKHDSLKREDNVNVKKKMLSRSAYQKVLEETELDKKEKSQLNPKESYRYNKISLVGMNLFNVSRWQCFEGAYGVHRKARMAAGRSMSSEWNFRSILENVPYKPIFIVGDIDYVSDSYPKYFKSFEKTEGIKLYYLKKAGHTAFIDRPETIKNIIEKAWLSD